MTPFPMSMQARRRWRRQRTAAKRRAKTYAFYRKIAPGRTEDPRYPWPRFALEPKHNLPLTIKQFVERYYDHPHGRRL